MVSEPALNLEGFLYFGYSTMLAVYLDMIYNAYLLVGNISITNFAFAFLFYAWTCWIFFLSHFIDMSFFFFF